MKEVTVDQQWKRVQLIWVVFSGYVFISALLFALSSHIHGSVYQIISVVLYFSIVGCAIASCAFRHGSDVAVLSHYSRQVFIFLLYSVLYWVWKFAYFSMISSLSAYKLSKIADQIYVMNGFGYAIKMLLFAVSLYGLLRARDHIRLGSTRRIVNVIVGTVVCVAVLMLVYMFFINMR